MTSHDLSDALKKLGATASSGEYGETFRFVSVNPDDLYFDVCVFSDGWMSMYLVCPESNTLSLASTVLETPEFDNEAELYEAGFALVKKVVNEGVRCHIDNGWLLQRASAVSQATGKTIFQCSSLRYSNFELPRKTGVYGCFSGVLKDI